MIKPCIIVFVGTVGAGKSTQIRQLLFTLRKNDVKSTSTALKRGHFLTHMLEVFLARLFLEKGQDATYPIEVTLRNRPDILKKLFKFFMMLDAVSIFCRFFLTVYVPKKLGYVVLVEEYIPGALADYEWLSKMVGARLSSLFARLLTSLTILGGPTYTIFLDAPEQTLIARWVYRKSPTQRVEYLEMQRTVLFVLSKWLSSSFIYINTQNKAIAKTGLIVLNFLKCPLDLVYTK